MVMYLHNACASILPSLSNVCPVPMPYNISNMKIKREVLNTQNLSLFMHLNPKSKIELPSMQISAAFANMTNRLFVILDPQNLFSGRNVHIIIPDFFEGIFEDVSKTSLPISGLIFDILILTPIFFANSFAAAISCSLCLKTWNSQTSLV